MTATLAAVLDQAGVITQELRDAHAAAQYLARRNAPIPSAVAAGHREYRRVIQRRRRAGIAWATGNAAHAWPARQIPAALIPAARPARFLSRTELDWHRYAAPVLCEDDGPDTICYDPETGFSGPLCTPPGWDRARAIERADAEAIAARQAPGVAA